MKLRAKQKHTIATADDGSITTRRLLLVYENHTVLFLTTHITIIIADGMEPVDARVVNYIGRVCNDISIASSSIYLRDTIKVAMGVYSEYWRRPNTFPIARGNNTMQQSCSALLKLKIIMDQQEEDLLCPVVPTMCGYNTFQFYLMGTSFDFPIDWRPILSLLCWMIGSYFFSNNILTCSSTCSCNNQK